YSNPGYNVLGALIEVVSGQPLDVFLRERIYEPLGMSDSRNHSLGADHSRLSVVYRRRGNEWVRGWSPGDPPLYPFVRASGGMISTAWDYALFLQTLLDGGRLGSVRLLSPETVALMTTPHTREIYSAEEQARQQNFYGYGWQVYPATGIFSHTGSDGTYAWVDPAHNMFGMVLTQSPGGTPARQ